MTRAVTIKLAGVVQRRHAHEQGDGNAVLDKVRPLVPEVRRIAHILQVQLRGQCTCRPATRLRMADLSQAYAAPPLHTSAVEVKEAEPCKHRPCSKMSGLSHGAAAQGLPSLSRTECGMILA